MRYSVMLLGSAALGICLGCSGGSPPDAPAGEAAAPGLSAVEDEAPLEWFEAGEGVSREDLDGATKLVIVNPLGSVNVASEEPGVHSETTVELRTRPRALGRDENEARQQLAQASLATAHLSGNELKIELPSGLSRIRADLDVRAPSRLAVVVKVNRGDVTVSGMSGAVSVSAQSGRTRVEGISGAVSIHSETGDVHVMGAPAGATLYTGTGDIVLTGGHGDVICRTMTGDMDLEYISGDSIIATTQSGDVRLRALMPFAADMEVRTDSGALSVELPMASDCRVKTMTDTGETQGNLPLRDVTRSGPNIEGRLGAGAGQVLITSRSGGITLSATQSP